MMPVAFVGHGSPMNAVEDNPYSRGWRSIAEKIPKPEAILMISAHWYVEGTRLQTDEHPKTIYDFYGFPKELYDVEYPAPGTAALAEKVRRLVPDSSADNSWGIDHGAWSVLRWMYPEADIPVCQMSVDGSLTPQQVFETGKLLRPLRDEGVLVIGSGNVVHNLRLVDYSGGAYDWAQQFDAAIRTAIEGKDFDKAVHYDSAGESARLSVPYPDHFYPLLYILGAAEETDEAEVFNADCVLGSLSMTSYLFSK